MIRWHEGVGLLFSGDDLLTEHGKIISDMHDEICRLNKELKWWRDAAFGGPPDDSDF